MGRVIKRDSAEAGDISPDSGFAEVTSTKNRKIISSDTFDAKTHAQAIRDKADSTAEQILEQAQADAAALLEQARTEAEQLKEQAREQGYTEGREQGASELSEMVGQSSRRLQLIEEQAVPQLKQLALSIARKILGKELEFHPEAVVDIVKQALGDKARQRREIFLRVNPEDLALIRENKADLLEVLSRSKEIGLREDPDVARFGVIIETEAGTIDAQLETQLAVFERVLKEKR